MLAIRRAPLRSLSQLSRRLWFPKPALHHFATTATKMGAPVILCGKTEAVGTGVIAALKPEFDGALIAARTAVLNATRVHKAQSALPFQELTCLLAHSYPLRHDARGWRYPDPRHLQG